jgi:adenylate kinase family enzyme
LRRGQWGLFQRDDDQPETIEKRLRVFNDLTEPLIAYYHGLDLLETIKADKPISEVAKDHYRCFGRASPGLMGAKPPNRA